MPSRPAFRPEREGVSKGEEDGRRPCALWLATPQTAIRPFGGSVARPQGVEGSGMAGPDETLGSP
jgi:hypothetical protein